MGKFRRILSIFTGIVMVLIGAFLIIIEPSSGMKIVLFFIQLGMTMRGLGSIWYYLTMARYMVGGKNILYRGMIFLDLGILAGSLFEHPAAYAIIYIAMLHVFSGAVSVLRANESRKIGAHWRLRIAYGVADILMAATVVISGVIYKSPVITIYLYGAGLIYTAVLRIISAFRRTDIVYIQ